jgi:thioredoxin 1
MTDVNNIVELNNDNFYNTVNEGITLVDFWAPWCGPCRMQGPILEGVNEAVGKKAKIGKLNVDDFPYLAGDFNVRSIPTLILFKDGKPVTQYVGVQTKETLVNAINSF